MKIISISDLHGELLTDLPPGDVLTISGDICPVRGSHHPVAQKYWIENHFIPWCRKQIADDVVKNVVFCHGNHDFIFEKMMNDNVEDDFRQNLDDGIHFLRDSEITIDGKRFYGTPWTLIFNHWANMESEAMLHNRFMNIPEGIDVLLSHGPAFGWNDTIMQYNETEHLGSTALRENIIRANPLWTLCGHIHSGNHKPTKIPSYFDNDSDGFNMINIVNVSILDENYEVVYEPFEFTLE